MSMQGFRNLIKSSTFIDQSFQQLLKKSDEYRKSSKMSLDFVQSLYKVFETHDAVFEKLFKCSSEQTVQKSEKSETPNRELVSVFERIFKIQNQLSKKFGNNIKQTVDISSNLFSNYSNLIVAFQSAIRAYIKNEQTLLQQSKRYFKNQKTLIQNLQIYKTSFTDVKLIYNNDEKIKRYAACESIYRSMLQELKSIEERINATNKLKKQIAENYKNIEYQFSSAIKIVGNRIITLAELFVFQYQEMFKKLSIYLQQRSTEAIKIKFGVFFNSDDSAGQEALTEIAKQNNKKYPYFIIYFANMKTVKPQFYPQIVRLFNGFIRQVSQKIENRKKSQKYLSDFIFNYFKQYEKVVLGYLRDLNNNYDKNKKKISQIYGAQHMSFMKSFTTVFERIVQNGDILNKSISLRVKAIQIVIQQSAKSMDAFMKDARACFERTKKKQGKKMVEQETMESQLRAEIQEKSMQLQTLIDSLLLKLNQTEAQLNIHFNAIINDMLGNALQLREFCKQFHQDEFQQSVFIRKYQGFQAEVDEILKAKITFFGDLSFASLLSEKDDLITFEPELNKIEEFKKIKKPAEYDGGQRQSIKKKQSLQEKFSDLEKKFETPRKTNLQEAPERSPDKSLEKMEKYEQFLLSKTIFQQGQRFCKSYACGLSDKIILTGRLFVTTQRLCFYSKFNPNNVFFGDTFIQIPRKDILKVEKRQNAIIFNNSISVTTVNGEMFFTSFFARNQAYDSICQALEISVNEELMFELAQEDLKPDEPEQEDMQDDLKPEEVLVRTGEIDSMIEKLDYVEIHVSEYTYPGLNAYKFFKLFDSSSEINYSRKTFKGFNMYFKELLDHKEIAMEEWNPTLAQFLNPANIKQGCPLKFEKVCTSIIPVSNSGIPLMPKQAHLRQQSQLYFYSKDKYVIVSKVQNSGIPYCEYFNIRYKKVIESVAENRCRFTLYYYIEFVQKTMMRSVIQSKSMEESKVTTARMEAEMKKYLKHLEKLKAKAYPNEASKESLEEKLNQLQKDLLESKERQQQLEREAVAGKQQIQRSRKWLVISLLLNVLLVMIIVTLY